MIDPLRAFLESNSLQVPALPASSRYYGVGTNVVISADGLPVAYLKRRFLPEADRFALLHTYVLTEGDRVDNLAHRFLGDPEQFWRLCDANDVMRPDELTCNPRVGQSAGENAPNLGRVVRITLPEGVPGSRDD